MAHGRKFRTTRHTPDSERSMFEQRMTGRYSRILDRNDLLNLIRGGEDTYLEFKIRLVNTEKITAEVVALANGGGGALIFGVNDQRRVEGVDDPEQVEEQLIDICRNQIKPAVFPRIDKVAFDSGIRIVVLQVDDRRAPHCTSDGQYFIRIGSTKREADGAEIAQLFARSRAVSFEDTPIVPSTAADVDEALVWSYIRDADGQARQQPNGFPTADILRDLRLANLQGVTLGGLLLFGSSASVQKLIPQSQLDLTRISGLQPDSPVVERASHFGNLCLLYDRAIRFVERYVDLWEVRPPRAERVQNGNGSYPIDPVRARANFSRDVIREAITNLLVHRNYAVAGPPARILIYDDRIEIVNPSRNADINKKAIEYGIPSAQNPKLHRIFTSAEYGLDPFPRGIPALRRTHYSFTHRDPRISLPGDEFRLELAGV